MRHKTTWIVTWLAITVLAAAACGRLHFGADTTREVNAALRNTLRTSARPSFVTSDAEGTRLWKLTRRFYERRQYAPAWIENAAPRPQMDDLIRAIAAADREGLDPGLYSVSMLQEQRDEASSGFLSKRGFDPNDAGTMDVWLTYLYMKYASDLADGLSDLAHADASWRIETEKFDPLTRLEQALRDGDVSRSLSDLAPTSPEYRRLRQALAEYRDRASKGGWPAVPATLTLKPGQRGARVTLLARRLAASGDFAGRVPSGDRTAVYDGGLKAAVQRFQRRHGLADDGVVGPAVVRELNVPIERRIRQIQLNMERWRWLPRDLGDRHILVNIPDMRLDVWDHDRVPLTMRVVVGKKDTPTPIFNDEMSYLVFSPYLERPARHRQ